MHAGLPALIVLSLLAMPLPVSAADGPVADVCLPTPKDLSEPGYKIPDHCPCMAGPLLEVTGASQHAGAIQAKVHAVLEAVTGDPAPTVQHNVRTFQVQDTKVPVRTVTMSPIRIGASLHGYAPCGDELMTMDAEAVAFMQRIAADLRSQRDVALRVKVLNLDFDSPPEPAR